MRQSARDGRCQKTPIVVSGRRHFRTAGADRPKIAVAKPLRIIEERHEAALGSHDGRVLEVGAAQFRKGGMPLKHESDSLLPLCRVPHLRCIRGD